MNSKKQEKAQTELNAWIDKGVDRYFEKLNEEEKEVFKASATKLVRTYAFILQIATFIDVDLHKLYIYLNCLLRKLPRSSKDKEVYMADMEDMMHEIYEAVNGWRKPSYKYK